MDDILKKYPNDVKVIVKNFPLSFHKQARRAAQYSLAAHRQGKYKEMYHAIFEDFRKLKTNEDFPLEIAETLGLDVEQLKPLINVYLSDNQSLLRRTSYKLENWLASSENAVGFFTAKSANILRFTSIPALFSPFINSPYFNPF